MRQVKFAWVKIRCAWVSTPIQLAAYLTLCAAGAVSYRSARTLSPFRQAENEFSLWRLQPELQCAEAFGYSGHAETGDYLGLTAAHRLHRWFPWEQQQLWLLGRRQWVGVKKIPRNALLKKTHPSFEPIFADVPMAFAKRQLHGMLYMEFWKRLEITVRQNFLWCWSD